MIPATFCLAFSGFWAGFEMLFWGFLRFQLLFPALFWILGLGLGCCFGDFSIFSYFFLFFSGFLAGFWGAVWGIYAVSATFFCSFPDFWRGLGCCLGNLCGFSSTRPACYAINLWLLYIMIIEKSSIF